MSGRAHWLESLFEDPLTAEVSAQQIDELHQDTLVQETFDALALADRELSGELGERSLFERRVGEFSMLQALDGMLEEEASEQKPAESVSPDNVVSLWDRMKRSGVLALAAASVMVVGAGLLWQAQTGERVDGEFQARSASGVGVERVVEVRPEVLVYCGMETGAGFKFVGEKDSAFGVVRCPVDGELKFAVRQASKVHVALVGVSESGGLLWYGPTPVVKEAQFVEVANEEPVALGESIRLGVNHEVGRVRVMAIFSKTPLSFDTLKERVDGGPQAEVLAKALDATVVERMFEVIPSQKEQQP